MSDSPISAARLAESPELERIIVQHSHRGLHLQAALRGALVAFITLTVALVPPMNDAAVCFAILAGYGLWALGVTVWAYHGAATVRSVWVTLYVDVAVLAALTLLTGIAAQESWTADILTNGLFVIPLLACTQLRVGICTGVVAAATAAFFLISWATMASNQEPWSSILLSTLAIALLSCGSIVLTRIQRSRVRFIASLALDRTELLAELMNAEKQEQQNLSEQLHDGALQYVLAARQDLEDLKPDVPPEIFGRLEFALRESSTLLRNTVSQLHPAVLEHAGLARALQDLVAATAARAGLRPHLDVGEWPDDVRSSADGLLFGAARELIGNVVKHAQARQLWIRLARADGVGVLEVSDDGSGMAADVLDQRLDQGHIGLASRRLRIAAAGGRLDIGTRPGGGTRVQVTVPYSTDSADANVAQAVPQRL